ncbi:hypothetical protein [Trebonia sp.]|uniref:hypothetical protein n=1 Tax=Trebonia sp. TaxID=2767075 RepID=UPI00261D6234|nr:hypothetical protein [Trebonia sp.]
MALVVILGALIATGLWLWMAQANKGGRSWARIMATVFFGFLTIVEPLILAWLITLHITVTFLVVSFTFFLVYWLTGLSAVVLLWRRPSSDYYNAAGNRSKAIRVAAQKPDQPAVRGVTHPDPN